MCRRNVANAGTRNPRNRYSAVEFSRWESPGLETRVTTRGGVSSSCDHVGDCVKNDINRKRGPGLVTLARALHLKRSVQTHVPLREIGIVVGVAIALAIGSLLDAQPQESRPTSSGPSVEAIGHYVGPIVSVHTDMCLDALGETSGNNVQQIACHGGENQDWVFVPEDAGIFLIKSVKTGFCLDVVGGGTSNGANVQQHACIETANQRWRLVAENDNAFRLVGQRGSKCLDLTAGGTANGTNIQIWDCQTSFLGGKNQLWRFTNVGTRAGLQNRHPGPEAYLAAMDELLAIFLKLNLNDPDNSESTHALLHRISESLRQQAEDEAKKWTEISREMDAEAEGFMNGASAGALLGVLEFIRDLFRGLNPEHVEVLVKVAQSHGLSEQEARTVVEGFIATMASTEDKEIKEDFSVIVESLGKRQQQALLSALLRAAVEVAGFPTPG